MKLFIIMTTLLVPFVLAGQHPNDNISSTSAPGIVITEIMADPDPPAGLPNSEYCEIQNRGVDTIDLSGWTFFDGSIRNLPQVIIYPGEYIIICDDSDTALFGSFGKCVAVSSISLTNTGEKISIRNPAGNPVDSVIFSDNWYGDSFKKDGGWSLEKSDPGYPCQVSLNWLPSVNPAGGTPGIVNSVNGTFDDTKAPLLLRSYCPDPVHIILVFDEPIDIMTADLPDQYMLSAPFEPIGVIFDNNFPEQVNIEINMTIAPGTEGTISAIGIADCSGNINPDSYITRFGIADTSSSMNVVINEILFHPNDGGSDFIELFNKGPGVIDLQYLRLESIDIFTGNTQQALFISEMPHLLFPECFTVITESPGLVSSQYKSTFPFNFLSIPEMPSMNSDEGYIAISFNSVRIDAVHYFDDYHFELLEETQGVSLERVSPLFPAENPDTWHSAAASAGYATPGLLNSQYIQPVDMSSYVTVFPEIFSPDMDGIDDFLTIIINPDRYGYIENSWICNTEGQIIFTHAKNTLTGTNAVITWDGIMDTGEQAPPGIYIALITFFNLEGTMKKYKLPFVLAVRM